VGIQNKEVGLVNYLQGGAWWRCARSRAAGGLRRCGKGRLGDGGVGWSHGIC
jgi:hypothetical protein